MVETFYDVLRRQGISRRSFMKFCSLTAAALGLGPEIAPQMAYALETKPRVPVLWLHGLECTCCSEAFHPLGPSARVKDVVLSMISLDYDDTHHGGGRPSGRGDRRRNQVKNTRANIFWLSRAIRRSTKTACICIDGGKPFVEKLKWMARGRLRDHCLGRLRVLGLRAGRQARTRRRPCRSTR